MDRRAFLARSMAAAAGAAMAGEAPDLFGGNPAGAASNNGPGLNGVTTKPPKRGGHLIIGTDAEEQGFNPTSARFDEVGVMYARTVFDPLTIITADGGWAPYLAESVTPNADYTSWTVTLRPGVTFHDGSPCDGAAMLMNCEAQLNALLTGIVLKPIVQGFQQTGQYSVVWNFKSPFVPFPYYCAGGIGGQLAYLMAPAMINAPNGGTDNPIGTGPFKFKQWEPNSFFTATANPNYWRPGLPYLDQVTFKPIVDPNARSEALQSGTIDIMVTDTPQINVLYKGKPGWAYIDDSGKVVGEPDMNCVQLNLGAKPFDDPTVRLAAAKSISSPAYSRVIDIGFNPPTYGLFTKGSPYYSNVSWPSYDPSAAKKLVNQAQKKNGGPISFVLGSTNSPEAIRAAEYLQSQFQNAGFKVSLTTVEQNELINNALDGKYQAYVWRQFGAVNPDLNYIFWSSSTIIASSLSINMARNNDPRIDQQLNIGRTSTNPSVRAAAYQKIDQLFAQDLPYLWNDRAVWAVVAKPKVQNFDNPTTPTGQKGYGMITGSFWPTQIWLS